MKRKRKKTEKKDVRGGAGWNEGDVWRKGGNSCK
jgi:hypothetical protein